ncbi:hypothetical protein GE09DRAFT_975575 [Coniochaeta sp. 2T2.1]|nr:hypothetical protein GE09DRAFT_975575 [Coniochaeta sp. 2T2.1]
MTRITPQIYLYTPDPSSTAPVTPADKSSNPAPELILFSSWMGAGDKHIVKYLTGYQSLYPTSSILLIKLETLQVLIPSVGKKVVAPLAPLIRSLLPANKSDSTSKKPRLLIHLFSNAGNCMKSHLYDHYAATARPNTSDDPVLPPHTTVWDSSPGVIVYRGTVSAFSFAFPAGWARWCALPFVHLVFAVLWVYYKIPGTDVLAYYRERHNTPALVREVRRTYVYSDEDATIPAWGIEAHAAQARERGFDVRLEKFEGSEHVAHMRHDPERYWRIARETWEGQ